MKPSRKAALLVAVACLAVVRHPRAEENEARVRLALSYSAPEGAPCPSQSEFVDLVAARVGYDPFDADADEHVTVTFELNDKTLSGSWRLGEPEHSRSLSAAPSECGELASSLALSLSVEIDVVHKLKLKQAKPPPPPPVPETAAERRREEPSWKTTAPKKKKEPPPQASMRMQLSAGGYAALGTAPGVTAGGALGAGVRWPLVSLGLEGRAELPRAKLNESGSGVRGSLLGGGPVLCGYYGAGFLCGVLVLGVFRGEGVQVSGSDRASTFYSSAGPRVGLEIPLSRAIAVRGWAEALAPLTRTTLRSGNDSVWTTPSVGATAGLAVLANFP